LRLEEERAAARPDLYRLEQRGFEVRGRTGNGKARSVEVRAERV
jgi:hypothetical protein